MKCVFDARDSCLLGLHQDLHSIVFVDLKQQLGAVLDLGFGPINVRSSPFDHVILTNDVGADNSKNHHCSLPPHSPTNHVRVLSQRERRSRPSRLHIARRHTHSQPIFTAITSRTWRNYLDGTNHHNGMDPATRLA